MFRMPYQTSATRPSRQQLFGGMPQGFASVFGRLPPQAIAGVFGGRFNAPDEEDYQLPDGMRGRDPFMNFMPFLGRRMQPEAPPQNYFARMFGPGSGFGPYFSPFSRR